MERNTDQWTISLPHPLSKLALQIAKEESRTRSELIREALRQYLGRRNRFEAARKEFAYQLESRGIRTLEDVDRMIHDLRAEESSRRS